MLLIQILLADMPYKGSQKNDGTNNRSSLSTIPYKQIIQPGASLKTPFLVQPYWQFILN